MKPITKGEAIKKFVDCVQKGDSIPCVFNEEDYNTFLHAFTYPDANFDKIAEGLFFQEFTDNPVIAEEFEDNLDLKDSIIVYNFPRKTEVGCKRYSCNKVEGVAV